MEWRDTSMRRWQLSLEAQESTRFQELHEITSSIIETQETIAGDIVPTFENSFMYDDTEQGLAPLISSFSEFLTQDFVRTLSQSDMYYAYKASVLPFNSEWGYGTKEGPEGLYGSTEDVAEREFGTKADRYVLSGLVGYDLMGRKKELDTFIDKVEASPLERLILLGGVAIVSAQSKYMEKDGVSYYGKPQQGLATITNVGASFHGDFHMSASKRFASDATDPLGRKRPFAPEIPEVYVNGYHSVEPEILGAVLLHVSKGIDNISLDSVYRNVSSRLKNAEFAGHGKSLFADYGQGEGCRAADHLKYRLKDSKLDTQHLDSFVVNPGDHNLRLNMTSLEQGILFSNNTRNTNQNLLVPNEEIEDFIVALFSNGYGQTSPDALARVLEVIKTESTV